MALASRGSLGAGADVLVVRRAERLDEPLVHEPSGVAFEDEAVIFPEGVDRVHRGRIEEGKLFHVAVQGLAPLVVEHLQEQIGQLKLKGTTILLAEQNIEFVLALADRVFILQKGEIVFAGDAETVRSDRRLRDRYLAI